MSKSLILRNTRGPTSLKSVTALAICTFSSVTALAAEFQHGEGWSSSVSGSVSIGTSVRNQSPSTELISEANGRELAERQVAPQFVRRVELAVPIRIAAI